MRKLVSKFCFSLVIFAGDISPIDVYSHMPVACEEAELPYCYVPSREVCTSTLVDIYCRCHLIMS